MRMLRMGRLSRSGGRRPPRLSASVLAAVGALAAVGVPGAVSPAAAAASSQAIDWTQQAPGSTRLSGPVR
jgi:hypothetical protein